MTRLLAAVAAVAAGSLLLAAPVPKAVKKKNDSPEGTWELTEFHSNGKQVDHRSMVKYWEIEGEQFHIGPKGNGRSTWGLTIPDPDKPHVREFRSPGSNGPPYSATVVADGDTLRFSYCPDLKVKLTECKPDANVMHYVFKRAKPEDK